MNDSVPDCPSPLSRHNFGTQRQYLTDSRGMIEARFGPAPFQLGGAAGIPQAQMRIRTDPFDKTAQLRLKGRFRRVDSEFNAGGAAIDS